MKKLSLSQSHFLKSHWAYYSFLGLSFLFFLHKAILYASIGSFVPGILLLILLVILTLLSKKSSKGPKLSLKIWAIILLIWSSIRILLSLIDRFIKPLPESHVHEQLGLAGLILSLSMLISAIYLLRKRRSVFSD